MKLLAFGKAVNVTIGLPIVRTSVDHGTAFDIAGRAIADPGEHDRGRPPAPARGVGCTALRKGWIGRMAEGQQ